MNDYLYELLKLPKGTHENLAIKKIMRLNVRKREKIFEDVYKNQESSSPVIMAYLRHGNDILSASILLIEWALEGVIGCKPPMVN